MIQITSNIKEVSQRLLKKLYAISAEPNLDAMEREIAFTLAGEMRKRIHQQGQKSDGSQIGEYTENYTRVRRKYNRGGGKVILSLTRQMENDMTSGAIKTDKGYGIGFKNDFNFKKSQWLQIGIEPHMVKAHTRRRTIKAKVRGSGSFKGGKFTKGRAKTVTLQGDSYPVKSYQNKGWKGYGDIYKLTQSEKEKVKIIAEDFINRQISKI